MHEGESFCLLTEEGLTADHGIELLKVLLEAFGRERRQSAQPVGHRQARGACEHEVVVRPSG